MLLESSAGHLEARDASPVQPERTEDHSPIDDTFVRAHAPFVRRCLVRFGVYGADADDAVQDVFVIAMRRSGALDTSTSPRPWLYTVARNVAHNARRQRRRGELAMDVPPEVSIPAEQERVVHEREARSLVHRALDALPSAQRDVVILHRLEGWPMERVAETVGCPVATAHSRLRLGTHRLRQTIRRQAFRARCAAVLAALLGALASPPTAAAAAISVTCIVVGVVVAVQTNASPSAVASPPAHHAEVNTGVPTRPSVPAQDTPEDAPPVSSREAPTIVPPRPRSHRSRGLGGVEPSTEASQPALPEDDTDALIAETRALARARALTETAPDAAQRALQAYDAQFPDGQLRRERDAIQRALDARSPHPP
ncbi:MAG: sigma-70 family RNA polymerase sigma factor [Polyangiales bacterium]|nr:sigma-70 family RNA polymerase sigma factor [Sandaracinaceae bacterium]